MTISHSVLLRMRNVSDNSCKESQNTDFMLNNFFFPEIRAVSDIMWKLIAEADRSQMTV